MGHAVIGEDAHHVEEAVRLGQLVAQRAAQTALAHAALQPADVLVGHGGIGGLPGPVEGAEEVHPLVGHGHDGGVNFHLAGAAEAGRQALAGQGIEDRGLAALRQTDDA